MTEGCGPGGALKLRKLPVLNTGWGAFGRSCDCDAIGDLGW